MPNCLSSDIMSQSDGYTDGRGSYIRSLPWTAKYRL